MLAALRENLPLLLAAVGGGLTLYMLARRYPRSAIVGWLMVLVLLPVWFGPTLVVTVQPAAALGLIVAAAFLGRAPRPFGLADLLLVFFFVASFAPVLVGGATRTTVFTLISVTGVGVLLGRLAPGVVELDWLYAAIAVTFTLVAVLAISEFVFEWRPFVDLAWPGALYQQWGPVIERGGQPRVEGAFGHPIALGASLGLAAPLVLAAPFGRAVRLIMLSLTLGAVALTFSRIGLVVTVLGIALTLLFVKAPQIKSVRAPAAALLVLGLVAAVPALQGVFLEAGEESSGSAQYRGWLVELIPDIQVLGFSSAATRDPSGQLYFGEFASVDNQLLLLGLMYGGMAVVLGVALLVYAGSAVVAGRAQPATVAVVAHIPALGTVALITQYSLWFWFIVGIAVSSQVSASTAAKGRATVRSGGSFGVATSGEQR